MFDGEEVRMAESMMPALLSSPVVGDSILIVSPWDLRLLFWTLLLEHVWPWDMEQLRPERFFSDRWWGRVLYWLLSYQNNILGFQMFTPPVYNWYFTLTVLSVWTPRENFLCLFFSFNFSSLLAWSFSIEVCSKLWFSTTWKCQI